MSDRDRQLWSAVKRALLAIVAAIDTYLGTERRTV